MRKLVECVPNFSEGRDLQVIEQITATIRRMPGVSLLDVDPGYDTNRTVMTFIGELEAVESAAFECVRKAADCIDMRNHHGAHARQGAIDVLPFIPVANVSMHEVVDLAHRIAKRIGEELHIPIYLYEEAATRPERRNLADIRKGEYESLPKKLSDPFWKPDYGPTTFNARSGATQVGAREFLIAWNINLNTTDKSVAHDIALEIRENGRAQKDSTGKIIKDAIGNTVKKPGLLKAVKAVGWYIDGYKLSQVSVNQINYKITPLYETYETVIREADKRGVRVLGAELVGLVPKQAILDAGIYYLKRQKRSTGLPEADLLRMGYRSLGLDTLTPFDPTKKIIEYRADDAKKGLARLTVDDFVDEVSRESPAPGGGSVSALLGSLGSALGAMVCNLTIPKKGFETAAPELCALADRAQQLKRTLIEAIDEDSRAFESILAARGQPKLTDEEKTTRLKAIEAATEKAARVPLQVMKAAAEVLDLLPVIASKGNPASISDVGVAALSARAAVEGASMNVRINIKDLGNKVLSAQILAEHDSTLAKARLTSEAVLKQIEDKLQ